MAFQVGSQRTEDGGAAQFAEAGLQALGGVAVEPEHEVGVGSEAGDVVDAAQGHALGFDERDGCFEFGDMLFAERQRTRRLAAQDSPEGES